MTLARFARRDLAKRRDRPVHCAIRLVDRVKGYYDVADASANSTTPCTPPASTCALRRL